MTTPGFIPNPAKKCPKGHDTGTQIDGHKCSQRKCGEDKAREAKLHIKAGALDLDALAAANPAEASYQQRMELVNKPRNLSADEAKAWAETKLQELLPEAVANIAWDLRYGTGKAQSDAVDRVLKANGMDKRDTGYVGTGGTIILNIGSGPSEAKIPWLERVIKPKGDK